MKSAHDPNPHSHSAPRPRASVPARRKRRRWTDEEKSKLLAAFRARRCTAAEFARQAGVSSSLLSVWDRRRQAASDSGFARVQVAVGTSGHGPAGLVVHLGSDLTFIAPVGIDAGWLGGVLRAAASC